MHVKLDEESSYLTTFNSPCGRNRWKRTPFGISLAPEVFQRKMNELVEDLKGELIADDFVIVGYRDSHETAVADHDRNLNESLRRCKERGVVLNVQTLCLRETEVSFIGRVTMAKGLCVHRRRCKRSWKCRHQPTRPEYNDCWAWSSN